MIAHHARGVVEARLHVGAASSYWIFLEHVLDRITGGQKFQDRLHRDRVPATTGRPLQTSGSIEIRCDMI